MEKERDYERLRRENEALKRALERLQGREIESVYQQLEASYERERRLQRDLDAASAREGQLLRMLEHLTMGQPLPSPVHTPPPAEAPRHHGVTNASIRDQVPGLLPHQPRST
jgi:hypothetical protein